MIQSIQSLIGHTPLVPITRLNPNPNVQIYAKLEGQNPGGSVKDRAALNMITRALERREITKDTKLIEATSGNTGIALAMISSLLGMDMTLVMPNTATPERTATMKAYGATVLLTDATKGGIEYSRTYAEAKVKEEGYYMLNQFGNPDNWKAHFEGTGPEIWQSTQGRITHFVSAMGTTGTIMGTSRYLKSQNPNVQVVGAQPTDGSSIPGIRRWSQAFLPAIYSPEFVDLKIDVSRGEADEMAGRLAKEEGIFCGISSGGAFAATCKLVQTLKEGVVVFVVCDRGDRYASVWAALGSNKG